MLNMQKKNYHNLDCTTYFDNVTIYSCDIILKECGAYHAMTERQ